MSTTSTSPILMNDEELSLLDSLSSSELESWLSTVDPSHVPILLGRLVKFRKTRKLLDPLSGFSPQRPHPKQRLFLELECKEALYGGAAGGGKSSSLLLAALQFVHVSRYSALILRTDLQRLRLAGGLIPRSHEWLTGRASWNGSNFMWSFPNGATLQFGYLSNSMDKYRYGSSEYQFIGFDELTEFSEEDYLFMFSRLRMTEDIRNKGVFYRIRGASNPGGKGHEWVKSRFVTTEAEQDLKRDTLQSVYWLDSIKERRAFVPAKVKDNPSVDAEEYGANLQHLTPVLRERLMNGDWTVMPTGLVRPEWLRYYSTRDQMIDLLESRMENGEILHTSKIIRSFHVQECRRFITIDTAGGSKDLTDESKGRRKSWTVMGVWDFKRLDSNNSCLLLQHVYRGRIGFTEVAQKILALNEEWKPTRIRVEDKTMGPDLVSLLGGRIPLTTIPSGTTDKVSRAAPLLNMMEKGQVYFPAFNNEWKSQLEAELLSWQGLDDDTNDQVDMAAYAAIECGGFRGSAIKVNFDPRSLIESPTSFPTKWR